MRREIQAFLVAPMAACVTFSALAGIIGLCSTPMPEWPATLFGSLFFIPVAMPFAYGLTLVFGVPAFLVFENIGWLSARAMIQGATIFGFILGSFVALISSAGSVAEFIVMCLAPAICGASAGFAFWVVAYGRRELPQAPLAK